MSNEEIMVAGARAKTEFSAEIDRFLSTLTDQGIFFIHVGEELVLMRLKLTHEVIQSRYTQKS